MSQPDPALARARAVWTDERVERVCALLRRGEFLAVACRTEGHEADSLRDCMVTHEDVRATVAKARAEGVQLVRDRMYAAGTETDENGKPVRFGDWKREAWLLERLDRETFAPPTQKVDAKNELTGKDGAPLVLSPAEAKAELARQLAAMTPAQRAAWDALTAEESEAKP